MTLLLDSGIKVMSVRLPDIAGGKEILYIGGVQISVEEFLRATLYVLTNTGLREDDPRRRFVELVKGMTECDGAPLGQKRLVLAGDEMSEFGTYGFKAAEKL